MPQQHESSANEAMPSVAVRRAVSMPSPGVDPGQALGPRTPDPTPTPIPSSQELALVGRSGTTEEPESGDQEERNQAAAVPDGPEPEARAAVVIAGNDHGDGRQPDETASGRPRGPMLAAAAIAGTVLISTPFLVLGLGGDDEKKVGTAPVGGTTFDPGTSDDPPAVHKSESPSPSASKPSPTAATKSAEEKPAAGNVTEQTATPKVTAPPTAEVKKAEVKKAPTARELANELSNRANVLLKSIETGKCADIPGFGKGTVDGPVRQYDCRPTTQDNQLWDLKVVDPEGGPHGASLFVIKNRVDGLCVDVATPAAVTIGTKLSQNHCNDSTSSHQRWWLEPRPGALWFRHASSNLCLAVDGGRAAGDDARLKVVDCGDSAQSAERWSVVSVAKPAS
ncbi:RICIN domain-containing protein [Streptomyces sp. NPDC058001]|uniref:RICIN domain-containing protein n=1 Tax=Streptomyces sp. NPDC058001 TaxID=3346300 RepID=UPI0036E8D669